MSLEGKGTDRAANARTWGSGINRGYDCGQRARWSLKRSPRCVLPVEFHRFSRRENTVARSIMVHFYNPLGFRRQRFPWSGRALILCGQGAAPQDEPPVSGAV